MLALKHIQFREINLHEFHLPAIKSTPDAFKALIQTNFLKEGIQLYRTQTGFDAASTKTQILELEKDGELQTIENPGQLKPFVQIPDPYVLICLSTFITFEEYSRIFSPYRVLGIEPGRVELKSWDVFQEPNPTPVSTTFQKAPSVYFKNDQNFSVEMDCLCDNKGKLARMRFAVVDSEFKIIEAKIHSAESGVRYSQY